MIEATDKTKTVDGAFNSPHLRSRRQFFFFARTLTCLYKADNLFHVSDTLLSPFVEFFAPQQAIHRGVVLHPMKTRPFLGEALHFDEYGQDSWSQKGTKTSMQKGGVAQNMRISPLPWSRKATRSAAIDINRRPTPGIGRHGNSAWGQHSEGLERETNIPDPSKMLPSLSPSAHSYTW